MKNTRTTAGGSRLRRLLILLSIIAVFSLLFCIFVVYHLFFSDLFKESSTLTVPDLVGETLTSDTPRDAGGFQTVRIGCYSDSPVGTVLSQYPTAGSKRKAPQNGRYATLTLFVSKGRETVAVPDMRGASVESAVPSLLTSGLSYTRVDRFNAAPSGTVIAQSPAAGERLPRGAPVTLTVSLGEEAAKRRVPNLCELTLVEAHSLAEASGLRIGSVTYRTADGNAGTVLSQFPLSGTAVSEGAQISLTVRRAPAPSEKAKTPPEKADPPPPDLPPVPSPELPPEGGTPSPPARPHDEVDLERLLDDFMRRHAGESKPNRY